MTLFIGLMSGTSMDGIDAAIVDVDTHRVHAALTFPYAQEVKTRLGLAMSNAVTTFSEVAQLHTLIGRQFALATQALLKQATVDKSDVRAIGSHGQTICHNTIDPVPYTMQLGCPHTIAEMTGIDVVADFRTRDLVIGGQGAPFAPLYHQALFAAYKNPLAIVNIGGITNITFLNAGQEVHGFDVGPGNCLLDAWAYKHLSLPYDKDGAWGATGRLLPTLLADFKTASFLLQSPPKSIGKEYFSMEWLLGHLLGKESPEDVQATLVALTADTIADTVRDTGVEFLAVCGGGVHNQLLMQHLRNRLYPLPVVSTMDYHFNPDFIEAMMFAWLAAKAVNAEPVDYRAITGASKKSVLGVIYKKPICTTIGF